MALGLLGMKMVKKKIKEVIIGLDAIAIIVNPKLGVHELNLTQIGQIFEGKIKGIDENGKLNIEKRDGRDCFYGLKEVSFL